MDNLGNSGFHGNQTLKFRIRNLKEFLNTWARKMNEVHVSIHLCRQTQAEKTLLGRVFMTSDVTKPWQQQKANLKIGQT